MNSILKKGFFILLLSFLFAPLNTEAQLFKKKHVHPVDTVEVDYKMIYDSLRKQECLAMYQSALNYNDLESATTAIYGLMAADPADSSLFDSLAILFIARNMYVEAILIGSEIIERDPKNDVIVELVAVAEGQLGLFRESLKHYEQLYGLTGGVNTLYQIASLQFRLRRYGECSSTVEALLASPQTETLRIQVNGQDNKPVEIYMRSALWNIKGVMAMELNQVAIAKKCFEESLKIEPNFNLAIGNLKVVNDALAKGQE